MLVTVDLMVYVGAAVEESTVLPGMLHTYSGRRHSSFHILR
jgi:hypothetical protein